MPQRFLLQVVSTLSEKKKKKPTPWPQGWTREYSGPLTPEWEASKTPQSPLEQDLGDEGRASVPGLRSLPGVGKPGVVHWRSCVAPNHPHSYLGEGNAGICFLFPVGSNEQLIVSAMIIIGGIN